MNRCLILLVLLLPTYSTFSQEKLLETLPLIDGKVTYTGVVRVDSVARDELYNRARRWFIDSYKSGKDVIQLDDKENGEVIGKGFFSVYWQATFLSGLDINVWQTIKIQVKDGRYRFEISDFKVKYRVSPSHYTTGSDVEAPIETWNTAREDNCKKVLTKVNDEVTTLITSLEQYFKTPPKNDW